MKLERLWCQVCDMKLVDPTDPTTGTFYRAHGHTVKNDGTLGNYRCVVFSVCKECAPRDAVKEVSKD